MLAQLLDLPALDKSAGLIFALLPGLLAYLIHHELTARGEPIEALHAVLWALTSTLIVTAIWSYAKTIQGIPPIPDIVGLSLTAVVLGFAGAWLTGSGRGYGFLRRIGFTRGSTHTTVWHTTFANFRNKTGEFAIFHMDDGKVYYGKICHYSRNPTNSHVLIDCYTTLNDGQTQKKFEPADTEHNRQLLIRGDAVKYVEFLPHSKKEQRSNVIATTPAGTSARTSP